MKYESEQEEFVNESYPEKDTGRYFERKALKIVNKRRNETVREIREERWN